MERRSGRSATLEAFFLARGVPTVRVRVDPREFAAWCAAHHQDLNAKGPIAFSAWAALSGVPALD